MILMIKFYEIFVGYKKSGRTPKERVFKKNF